MLIKREKYLEKIRPFYDLDIIKVLVGSRRSGKSKMLEQIILELKEKNVKDENIIYINFENLDYYELTDYLKLNSYIKKLITNNDKYYLFFDEIQNVSNFEKAINSFRVSLNASIFITGSNSKMLSSEISTLLTGRIIEFMILPFSYKESLELRDKLDNNISNSFYDYLEFGGYPFRFNLKDRNSTLLYLNEIFNNIVTKDIFARDTKIDKTKFMKVVKYILVNAGNDFNAAGIYNYLKSNNNGKEVVSLATIYNYLLMLEQAFIIKPIYRYNISGKEVLKTNPKYYAIDNGFRIINASGNIYDRGRFLENIIYLELLSRGYDVYIGKTYKGEVDFIACLNNKKCFIQVAYILDSNDTIEREFSAFKPIKDNSPKYVFSLDQIDMSMDGITHINIIDFLLDKVDIFIS